MKFTEHRDSHVLTVKSYQDKEITINDQKLTQSFYLNQSSIFKTWPIHHISELTESLLSPLIELEPEVIILGSGKKQAFPSPSLVAMCAQNGIGLEVMNNASACKTYNVLTTEERSIILAIIIE